MSSFPRTMDVSAEKCVLRVELLPWQLRDLENKVNDMLT